MIGEIITVVLPANAPANLHSIIPWLRVTGTNLVRKATTGKK